MNELMKMLSNSKKFNSYIEEIDKSNSPVMLTGLTDVMKMYFAYGTKEYKNKKICIVTYNEIQARTLVKNLQFFTDKVVFIPKKEIVTYDYVAESKDLPYERIEALNKIEQKKADVIVTTIESLMQGIVEKEVLYRHTLQFRVGSSYSLEQIKQDLVHLGYLRCDLIEARGQFSLRGGILDIALNEKKGIRIEFWGDEVDSIRYFNIASQRSTDMCKEITIFPAHEFVLEDSLQEVVKRIEENSNGKHEEVVKQDIEQILNGGYISKIDKYFNSFYNKRGSLLDYIEKEYVIFLDEITKIKARARNILTDNENIQKVLSEKEKMIPDAISNIEDYEEIAKRLEKRKRVYLEKQDVGITDEETLEAKRNEIHFESREIIYYKSSMEVFLEDIVKAINEDKTVIVLGGNEEASKKLSLLLLEKEIQHKYFEKLNKELPKRTVIVTPGTLEAGFEQYDTKLILISSKELLNSDTKRKRKVHTAFSEGEKVVFADLKQGDYVVHKTHGIGQFIGVNTIKADNVTKDYIKIKYRDEDVLYIPTNQLDNIRKYIGAGEKELKLNRLGSKEWSNTKAKVKNNLREVARDLIELYAKRQNSRGFAFSKDTPWQSQFEDSFPYVETDDQLRCIEEVKKDMEKDKPMDRLLCGDVGYGKTEVAIRAAFKACMDQKQVAYLVPTTVLASQQYESFKERMEAFAIKVELLNRFRTKKEQEEVIKKLKLGEVDVVIGTHRLLSKDVEFKDLGLLIIDEEHRFGVKDKEKIKELKTNVDVLTMTATPIPRTLHMSIVGVRDMSVIYEPPQDRRPVQTYVLEYDEEVVKEAITKELERKGQVFYLFNNVENIELKARQISNLIPEARVAFAHGKMTGSELEDIMMDFINRKVDILVCTTILESGIDIPNANTIIVENADRLGLAQLYQIRGRVGRSSIQSYAYITYKPDKLLSEVADKRLKAIKEFTEFGSGFKIAMRDLEIRGAGSLLGEIQHGHMDQVGYDTYCKLLDEVIKEIQGVEVKEEIDVQIDLDVSSYIPDEYIENSSQKIEIYQDIALARTEEDIENVTDEMIDRYGPMPEEVNNLLEIARIKELCKTAYVTKIAQRRESIVFNFDANNFKMEVVDMLVKKYRNEIRFSPGKEPYITYKVPENSDSVIIKKVKEFLKIING
ncbi:MAG: transcription-repair coupling factor [Clostridia bacterium]|nr:transcription-repair coupling factor [Clostridia bacterium]